MSNPGMGQQPPDPDDGQVRCAGSSTSSYSTAEGQGAPLTDTRMLYHRADEERGVGQTNRGRARCVPMPPFLGTYCLMILLLLISAISCLVGYLIGSGSHAPDSNTTTTAATANGPPDPQRMTAVSPVSHDLGGLNVSTVQFNGSFFHLSVFRQPPSPEVDAAWEGLGVDYRPVVVPDAQAAAVGLEKSHVRVSDRYGGGYIANVEGLHHLHCLNLLRKALYFNHDYYKKNGTGKTSGTGAFENDEHILEPHITHCLDTLRQRLMCVVDVGMLGQVWWNKQQPQAFPNFSTNHTCWGGYEDVRKWAQSHQAPVNPPADYLLRPRDEDVLARIP